MSENSQLPTQFDRWTEEKCILPPYSYSNSTVVQCLVAKVYNEQ